MSNVVIERLSKIIIDPAMKHEHGLGGHWHPSSASVRYINNYGENVAAGTCLRQQYYRRTKVQGIENQDFRMRLKQCAGDVWSDWLNTKVKEAGFYLGDEVPFFNDEYNYTGKIDLMVTEEGTGHPVGVDWKTTGTYIGGGKTKIVGNKPFAPGEDHVLQMMLYLYNYMPAVQKWVILYIDRDSFDMAEHEIRLATSEDGSYRYPIISNAMGTYEWHHLRFEDIFARWNYLADCLRSGSVPERDYQIQYPNSRIVGMFQRGDLNKTDTKKVGTLLKKKPEVSDTDPIILEKGDWQCRFCEFVKHCHQEITTPASPVQTGAEL